MNVNYTVIEKIIELSYQETEYVLANNQGIEYISDRIGNGFIINKKNTRLVNSFVIHANKVCLPIPKCNKCNISYFCEKFRRESKIIANNTSLKIVDLFCGAGGFSLGFKRVGYEVVFAIDNQPVCVETFKYNHPEMDENSILCKNIELSEKEIMQIAEEQFIDVVIGGPPCQGFSLANRQRMIDDPRNNLYKHFVKAIQKLKPRFFVMENVEGILKIKDEIIEDFAALEFGYEVVPIKINASSFGVPQNRKRVFFIGTREKINLNIIVSRITEISKERQQYLLKDALFGLRPLHASRTKNATNCDSDLSGSIVELNMLNDENDYTSFINSGNKPRFIYNHKARYNNDRDIEIFSRLYQGDKSDDPKIADIMPYASRNSVFRDKYYRLQNDKPCKTITAHMKYDCNMYIHPTQPRGLTPREAARVQSYPDDYFFCGSYTKTFMQIGNSVPPIVAEAIAIAIAEQIR